MSSYQLPLFPLNVVICPEGLMNLRIFEARYLDMIKTCLRNQTGFAIVAALPDANDAKPSNLPFASVGTVVEILDADVTTVGLILISCRGRQRVSVNSFTVQSDGLVVGDVTDINHDLQMVIPDDLKIVSENLQKLIESLPLQGFSESDIPILKPYKYNDSAWVSNRWVELLDLPLIQKQRLMQIDSPIVRLELVYDILNTNAKKLS
jgi:Lon protease-like protein